MAGRMNRQAYEQLITEDIEAMEKVKPHFVKHGVRLEWEHIVICLKSLVDLHYGKRQLPKARQPPKAPVTRKNHFRLTGD